MSESTPATPAAGGGRRRAASGQGRAGRSRGGLRLDPAVLLAVLLPVLALGLGLLVRTEVAPAAPRPAEEVPRAQALLVCPATGGGGEVRRAAASTSPEAPDPAGDDAGALSAAPIGAAPSAADPADGAVAAVAGADPATATVLRATGAASAGLAATSSARGGQDAAACGEPVTSAWLTGLGAGAEHASTVVLSNPDTANAVAELTLLGPDGEVDAPSVRSLVVEAGSTRLVDLASAVPSRDDLSLQVDVTRGRLAVSALDDGEPGTGAAQPSEARIALGAVSRIAATRSARATTLLGLPRGASYGRTITIANPGDEQARVSVRVLGESGGFVPQGLDAVEVRPGTTRAVDLGEALAALPDGAADETLGGVRIESDVPVAAGLVSAAGSRRVHAVALDASPDAQLVLPAGLDVEQRTLWLVDAGDGGGAVRLQAWDASGEQVQDGEVELLAGAGTAVRLSARAARVRVTGPATVAGGLSVAVPAGPAVLPLAAVRTTDLVPQIGTGRP